MDIPSCRSKPVSASLCNVRGHQCTITPTLPGDARVKYGREMTQTEQRGQKYLVNFRVSFHRSLLKSLRTTLKGVSGAISIWC